MELSGLSASAFLKAARSEAHVKVSGPHQLHCVLSSMVVTEALFAKHWRVNKEVQYWRCSREILEKF